MPRLYNVSLKEPKFEVTPFQPIEYKPAEINTNILANSIAEYNKKSQDAYSTYAALDTMFSNATSKLNRDDKETMQWYDNFQKKYKDEIRQFMINGNYGDAVKFGTMLASEAANDKEFLGRQHSYETYKKQYDTIEDKFSKGSIRKETFELWKEDNPYFFTPMTDKEGNVLGGYAWEPTTVPVDDINFFTLYKLAEGLINPDSTSSGSSVGRSWGKSVEGESKSGHKTSGSSSSKTEVTKEQIYEVVKELYDKEGVTQEAVTQAFRADRRAYQNQIKRVDDLNKQLIDAINNGESSDYIDKLRDSVKEEEAILKHKKSLIYDDKGNSMEKDYDKYLANRIYKSKYADALAYRNTTHNTNLDTGSTYSDKTSNLGYTTPQTTEQPSLLGQLIDKVSAPFKAFGPPSEGKGNRNRGSNGSGGNWTVVDKTKRKR